MLDVSSIQPTLIERIGFPRSTLVGWNLPIDDRGWVQYYERLLPDVQSIYRTYIKLFGFSENEANSFQKGLRYSVSQIKSYLEGDKEARIHGIQCSDCFAPALGFSLGLASEMDNVDYHVSDGNHGFNHFFGISKDRGKFISNLLVINSDNNYSYINTGIALDVRLNIEDRLFRLGFGLPFTPLYYFFNKVLFKNILNGIRGGQVGGLMFPQRFYSDGNIAPRPLIEFFEYQRSDWFNWAEMNHGWVIVVGHPSISFLIQRLAVRYRRKVNVTNYDTGSSSIYDGSQVRALEQGDRVIATLFTLQ